MCLAVLRNDNLLFRDAVVTMHPPRLLTRRPPARPQRYEKSSAETNENAVFDPTLPECRIFDEVKVRKAGRREDAKRRFRSDSAATQDLRRGPSPKIRTPREHKTPFSIRLCRDAGSSARSKSGKPDAERTQSAALDPTLPRHSPRTKPTLANIRGKSKIRICHERVDGPTRLFHILKNIPKSYAGDSEILYLCKDSPRRISTLTHFKTHKLKRLWYLTKNSVW